MWFSNLSLNGFSNQTFSLLSTSLRLAQTALHLTFIFEDRLGTGLDVIQPEGITLDAASACTNLSDKFQHWQQDTPRSSTTEDQAPYFLTITNATYYSEPATDIPLLNSDFEVCQRTRPTNISVPLCRIQFSITKTSSDTVVRDDADSRHTLSFEDDKDLILGEAWFPNDWYSHGSRFLALGNAGLGGCIDYENLAYGSRLHFATIGTNAGHSGDTGLPFYKHPEVFRNYAWQAVHLEATLGKELVNVYYSQFIANATIERQSSLWSHLVGGKGTKVRSKVDIPRKSYYLGCSAGGRQGLQEAMRFPDSFDGIVVGAPGIDVHRLMGWRAMIGKWLGATSSSNQLHSDRNSSYIPIETWDGLIAKEILRQCDGLDGKIDGIITEPDACDFRPEALLCEDGDKTFSQKKRRERNQRLRDESNCLTLPQVEALRKIYSPYYGEGDELVFPRYDPGAEANIGAQKFVLSGDIYPYAKDWMRYVIFNDSSYNFADFGLKDIMFSDKLDPSGARTFSGELSPVQRRGGKIITYHGRRDELIPSGLSKHFYNHISRTMGMPSLDSFYRLFLIPGMNHCYRGPGATYFGQHNAADPATLNSLTDNDSQKNNSTYNILLAMVDWVENGREPDEIIGTSESGEERAHCRYPFRSVWNYGAGKWECIP